jgi:hypothetical protein
MSEESYWLIDIADHTHMPKLSGRTEGCAGGAEVSQCGRLVQGWGPGEPYSSVAIVTAHGGRHNLSLSSAPFKGRGSGP